MAQAELPVWERRAAEEANLLNPGFLALVIHALARGYEKEAGKPVPYVLTFVALPLLLTSFLRDALPVTVRTNLAGWLQEHEGALLDFGERAAAFVPWIREGMLFGFRSEALELQGSSLSASTLKRRPRGFSTSDEFDRIRQRAFFVGRWFAHAGSAKTVMGLFGVRP